MSASGSSDPGTCNVPESFPFSIRVGLVFIAQAAGLSATAIICLLCYIVVSGQYSVDVIDRSDWRYSIVQ